MIVAAADGSALSNPGPAGWAWYVDDNCWAAGGWAHGTNNMGELMAVLDLLQQTSPHASRPLQVLCDSQYVINSVTKWMPGWKRRGWRKADGEPVLNVDLLREIDSALIGRRVGFEWVKGHSGHHLNEAADLRARAAAAAFQRGISFEPGPGFAGGLRQPPPQASPSVVVWEPDLFTFEETTQPSDSQPAQTAGVDLVPRPRTSSGPTPARPSDEDLVVDLERALLTDEVRASAQRMGELLHPEFTEVGVSGRIWSRGRMLAVVRPLDPPTHLEVVQVSRPAADSILLVWRARSADSEQGSRSVSLRSSLWVKHGGRWLLRFHQGTPAA